MVFSYKGFAKPKESARRQGDVRYNKLISFFSSFVIVEKSSSVLTMLQQIIN